MDGSPQKEGEGHFQHLRGVYLPLSGLLTRAAGTDNGCRAEQSPRCSVVFPPPILRPFFVPTFAILHTLARAAQLGDGEERTVGGGKGRGNGYELSIVVSNEIVIRLHIFYKTNYSQ